MLQPCDERFGGSDGSFFDPERCGRYFGDGKEGEARGQGGEDFPEDNVGRLVGVDEGDEGGDDQCGLGAGELEGKVPVGEEVV